MCFHVQDFRQFPCLTIHTYNVCQTCTTVSRLHAIPHIRSYLKLLVHDHNILNSSNDLCSLQQVLEIWPLVNLQPTTRGLVSVLGGVVFGCNNQTTTLPRPTVNCLNNVNELLLVLEGPVDLVVVSSAKINHNVLVPEEEHDCGWVIKLVHCVEIRHLCDVYEVYYSKVLYRLSNWSQNFIHLNFQNKIVNLPA